MKEYKVGDIITMEDVNKIKNSQYREEFISSGYPNDRFKTWNAHKKAILKSVLLRIISL